MRAASERPVDAASSPSRSRNSFSGTARTATLLLASPGLFLLNTPIDIAAAVLLAVYCWWLAGRRVRLPARLMRSFIWFVPGIVLANSLAGPGPKLWGLLSRAGALTGVLVAFRFAWAAWMAIVLIRSCPPQELLDSFRSLLHALRIPDRNLSLTLFLTLEMLPQFADIRVRDFWHLPDVLADRIRNVAVPEIPARLPQPTGTRFRARDLALLLPAGVMLVLAALVK